MIVDALVETDGLPALRRDLEDELSPELVLVDPDAAQRARDALPEITLTEVRLSRARAVERLTRPRPALVRAAAEVPVAAVPPSLPAPAPAPAPAHPAAPPPPPSYEDLRRALEEPAPTRRRLGRSVLAALIVVGVAAGIALALPRALDRRDSQTVGGLGPKASAAAGQTQHAAPKKATRPAHAKAVAHAKPASGKKAAVHKARKTTPASRRHASATPAASKASKPKPTRKHHRAAVRPVRPAIPDFVWVPAKDARGYLIEFRSGSKLVLRTHSKVARLHVSKRQLRPGRYRWYVWALDRGSSPVGKPLVDSTVRIR